MIKRKNFSAIILSSLLFPIIFLACNKQEGKVAQFRVTGEGIKLPEEWSAEKNVKWTYDISGRGWSSPIITGNLVIFTTAVNETNPPKPEEEAPPPAAPQPRADQGQRPSGTPATQPAPQGPPRPPVEDTTYKHEVYRWDVVCLNLKTGKELWTKTVFKGNPRTGTNRGNGYASETPATDGIRIYALFGMTGIACLDLYGNILWSKDPGAFKTLNSWGTGSSPVVNDGIVYIQADNEESSFILALDAQTGNEKWRAARDEKTTYSTPFVWKNKIRTEIVTTGKTARSYEPATGNILWECKIGAGFSIPSPTADKENIFIGNAGGPAGSGNLFAIKAGASGDISLADSTVSSNDHVLWSLPAAGTGNPSPLLHEGRIYIVTGRGGDFVCLDAKTGNTVYREKIEKAAATWCSPWVAGDKILVTDERGVTYVILAGEKYSLMAQNRIADKFWASPAISGSRYIFKGVKKIYCVGM